MLRPTSWQIITHSSSIDGLRLVYDSFQNFFTLKIHHNGDYVNLIDCDLFPIHEWLAMLRQLDLGDDKILFIHFRIPDKSLDDRLVPLMTYEDVLTFLKYMHMFKEIYAYIEINESLVEQHMMEVLSSQGKGVVIENIVKDNVVSEAKKEANLLFLEWHGSNETRKDENPIVTSTTKVCLVVESNNVENVVILDCDNEVPLSSFENVDKIIKIKEARVDTFMKDDLFQQDNAIDWKQDPYHGADEDQVVAIMFAELNQSNKDVGVILKKFFKVGRKADHNLRRISASEEKNHDRDDEVSE
nr:hypothetical protein [Tanacetum cinerariifolium]